MNVRWFQTLIRVEVKAPVTKAQHSRHKAPPLTSLRRARRNSIRYAPQQGGEKPGISRATLTRAERGDPAVAPGTYARILLALNLDDDVDAVARDDELGRKLQDLALTTPKRVRTPTPKVHKT